MGRGEGGVFGWQGKGAGRPALFNRVGGDCLPGKEIFTSQAGIAPGVGDDSQGWVRKQLPGFNLFSGRESGSSTQLLEPDWQAEAGGFDVRAGAETAAVGAGSRLCLRTRPRMAKRTIFDDASSVAGAGFVSRDVFRVEGAR